MQLHLSSAATAQGPSILRLAEGIHTLVTYFDDGSSVAKDPSLQGPVKKTIYLGGKHIQLHSLTFSGLL